MAPLGMVLEGRPLDGLHVGYAVVRRSIKRDVVIHVSKRAGCLALWWRSVMVWGLASTCWSRLLLLVAVLALWGLAMRRRAPVLVATVSAIFTAAAKHLHLVGHNLGGVAVLAGVLVLPLARLQATFDVNRPAFTQVFTGNFCQAVVKYDAVPFRILAAFAAVAVFPLRGRGNGNVADRTAVRGVAHLGVTSKVANQDDFVD